MDRPGVGVGVFVKKDGKILFQLRIGAHGANTWSLPGGHLEMYETIEECASREVLEEVGIKIKNIKILGFTNDIFQDEGKHYLTIFVDSEIAEGTPTIKEPEKMKDLKWFPENKLPFPLFLPIKKFMEKNTNKKVFFR